MVTAIQGVPEEVQKKRQTEKNGERTAKFMSEKASYPSQAGNPP